MSASFFFYDLETSGFSPKEARIMQFAGQRTDMHLKPIGKPYNYLLRMSEDVLPDPDAILVTGITPQKTIAEGLSEADFVNIFMKEISAPDTIFVGYNSLRFDDEFMRYLMYRNFYDPYEWHWQDRRSRWDILDTVRMTRALRPEGIKWPYDSDNKPVNRLELLASMNKLGHDNAHDALNDVYATIALARLVKTKQPKLFDYLLKVRDKNEVIKLVKAGSPFVYTSGKYAHEFEKTTVVGALAEHPRNQGMLVFDLRYDPKDFVNLKGQSMVESMRRRKDDPGPRLPVKSLKYNRCPAVAPLSVIDQASQARLQINTNSINRNYDNLNDVRQALTGNILEALAILDKEYDQKRATKESEADERLYDGFFDDTDKIQMKQVQGANEESLKDIKLEFKDSRLKQLLPLYKARNFPGSMDENEQATWENFRVRKLLGGDEDSRVVKYFSHLAELAKNENLTKEDQFILEELQLYGQSILPNMIE